MSIKDFSRDQYFFDAFSDGREVEIGSFNQPINSEASNVRLFMYFKGAFTNEQVVLYLKDDLTSPTYVYESSPVVISDIPDVGTDWLGWVRFDFNKQWIYDSTEIYMTAKVLNYTESPTKYVGFAFDFPNTQNGSVTCCYNQHPVKFQLFGYE